jgi:hypothetical protein
MATKERPRSISESQPELCRNALEIQFFGLQRSGNHAVLAWIFRQFDEPVLFFNNVKHFEDPFLEFRYEKMPNAVTVRRPPVGDAPAQQAARALAQRRLEEVRQSKKRLLAYSYENLRLSQLKQRALVSERETRIGRSEKIRRVLLLRDFYNWIASRIRLVENKKLALPEERGVDQLISLWIMYAREYLAKTNYLEYEQVVKISYNRWVEDEGYRSHTLDELAVPLKDNSILHVPDVGTSSFDGAAFGNTASETTGNPRQQYLLDDRLAQIIRPIRRRIAEIEPYNLEIFGLSSPL